MTIYSTSVAANSGAMDVKDSKKLDKFLGNVDTISEYKYNYFELGHWLWGCDMDTKSNSYSNRLILIVDSLSDSVRNQHKLYSVKLPAARLGVTLTVWLKWINVNQNGSWVRSI